MDFPLRLVRPICHFVASGPHDQPGVFYPRLGREAVASPTTFSCPSALIRLQSRSTRCTAPTTLVSRTLMTVEKTSPGHVCLAKRTLYRVRLPIPTQLVRAVA